MIWSFKFVLVNSFPPKDIYNVLKSSCSSKKSWVSLFLARTLNSEKKVRGLFFVQSISQKCCNQIHLRNQFCRSCLNQPCQQLLPPSCLQFFEGLFSFFGLNTNMSRWVSIEIFPYWVKNLGFLNSWYDPCFLLVWFREAMRTLLSHFQIFCKDECYPVKSAIPKALFGPRSM